MATPGSLPFSNLLSEAELLTLIEWDPEKFGIGVRCIDEQHKILITLANELTKAYIAVAYPKMHAQNSQNTSRSHTPNATAVGATPHKPNLKNLAGQVKAVGAIQKEIEKEVAAGLHAGGSDGSDPYLPLHNERHPFPVVGHKQFDPMLQRGSEIAKIVEDLVTYTCKFLLVEDHLLETYAYVDRSMQAQDHELLANEVSFLFKSVEDFSAQLSDVRRLMVFLRLWMLEHIPRDRKYAPMLIEKGVGSS